MLARKLASIETSGGLFSSRRPRSPVSLAVRETGDLKAVDRTLWELLVLQGCAYDLRDVRVVILVGVEPFVLAVALVGVRHTTYPSSSCTSWKVPAQSNGERVHLSSRLRWALHAVYL